MFIDRREEARASAWGLSAACFYALMTLAWLGVAVLVLGCAEPPCTPGERIVDDAGSMWICAGTGEVTL